MGNEIQTRHSVFDRQGTRLMVLMFTDVVGSVEMKARLGNPVFSRLLAEHDAVFHAVVADLPGSKVFNDLGDGFLARFESPRDAVIAALAIGLVLLVLVSTFSSAADVVFKALLYNYATGKSILSDVDASQFNDAFVAKD